MIFFYKKRFFIFDIKIPVLIIFDMRNKRISKTLILSILILSIISASSGLFLHNSEESKSEMDETTGTAISRSVCFYLVAQIKPENSKVRINSNSKNINYNNFNILLKKYVVKIPDIKSCFIDPPGYIKNLVIIA